MPLPKISVITVTYNCCRTLESTIQSVVSQDYANLEYVIVDGASTDGTAEMIARARERYSFIRSRSEPDKGIYDAMNKGVAMAEGEWLIFMGGDDIFVSSGVLTEIFGEGVPDPVDLLYGKVRFKHAGIIHGGKTDLITMMKNHRNICHQGIFYSRRTFQLVGEYDLLYPVYADFDFNIRCFSHPEITTRFIDKIIAVFNEDGWSKNGKAIDDFYDRLLLRYIEEYEDPKSLFLSREQLTREVQQLKCSLDYRLGRKILSPLRALKRLVRL